MTKYAYSDAVQREVDLMLASALGPSVAFALKAPLEDDFHGVDFLYVTSQNVAIAARMRYDRPAFAIDDDITFRNTEIPMIRAKTYAPLMLFGWLEQGRSIGGKLVDIYQMAPFLVPRLEDRPLTWNTGDHTAFITVDITELYGTKALLRNGDRHGWACVRHDSDRRLQRVLNGDDKRPGQLVAFP